MQGIVSSLIKGEPFFIRFGQGAVQGDVLFKKSSDELPDILFLHGSDASDNRNDFFLIRQVLLIQYGLTSSAFDFVGHGSTGGELYDSSLECRINQSAEIVNACFDSQPFSIVAVGMGVNSALKLSEMFAIKNLILILPEFSDEDEYTSLAKINSAHKINFFKEWEKIGAWSIFDTFQGNLSVISSCKGKHISSKFMETLRQHVASKQQAKIEEVANAPSRFMEYVNSEPRVLEVLAATISSTLNRKLINIPDCLVVDNK